ncbi:MAG: Asp-tRNA(Asn)/Glu-tRNA(Gln) amidotransferase subunit GatB, partial [Bdellovibrionales bacterium]|nr:Asp-tRNA(Asn)/Glu-tRNA(Gln) amidotransferase subunit GatB [Bdellovibrionales bacterium]
MAYSDYESVIGLEIHAQLLTESKMFCSCSTKFGAGDNENTCPVCLGMPGALPRPNKKAVDFAIRIGLALNCKVNNESVFARKNYFYPDLPKGYQISQFDKPICEGGYVDILLNGEKKRIGVTRAHMEEDAGKSVHHGEQTLLNYNRSSVPLVEIVSEPDLRSSKEAAEYARSIRSILLYLGVCDGNLEEGSMRCDCNVSVRKKGETKFGTRAELKNINSFRFIEKAIDYEIERQIDLIESGEKVVQETRLYDSTKNKTFSMRSKEEAHDYRYFPDPDLITAAVEQKWVEDIKSKMPELPVQRSERFQKDYSLPAYDSLVLTQSKALADFYEVVTKISKSPKLSSNWVMVELLAKLNEAKLEIEESPVKAEQLGELVGLIEDSTISGKIAKTVFEEMFTSGGGAKEIVSKKGL